MNTPLILFWILGAATLISALGVVALRNAVSAAMSLVASFFTLAAIYVLLWAHTIAVLQVLVYAGAIMVLFLFVIMLLNLAELRAAASGFSIGRLLGGLATAGLLAVLSHVLFHLPSVGRDPLQSSMGAARFGTLSVLGGLLYTRYLLPFEAVSLLLLVAILGAVVVAKSRI